MKPKKVCPVSIERRSFLSNCVKLTASAALIGVGSKAFAVAQDSYLDYGYCIYKCPLPCSYEPSCPGCRDATTGPALSCTARICAIAKGLPSCAHCSELATCNKEIFVNYPSQRTYALNKQHEWGLISGVVNTNNSGFNVHPSVAKNKLTITGNGKQEVNYNLFDLTGRSVKNGKFSTNSYLLDISDLTPGNYIINITKGDQLLYLSKIIKE